ncbi:MAG TPA: pantoate--beta-alanine ligase [Pseudomonadales bacterium]|nr:pantoate--beta-alanine ligase [Pseudomonadales bacterium]HNC68859.1 pantoate--beta-alanine ligase [Pseudomonadales bacterium]HND14033.1 pantoate--beta-alanine ligase [Pseudomonadales bacterium]
MLICRTFAEIRDAVGEWRRSGESVVFVPTLGNLHDGHLQLVELGARHGNRVVVSIFVNQLQFGRNEDYALYPRTLDADVEKLRSVGASALFCPSDAEVYPNGIEQQTTVTVPTMTDILCGATRPGHFTGVTTIVTKLFNIVQPDKAVFGIKDFQQLAVVRRMVQDLCLPIEIIEAPVARADDGLALSSRNGYLNARERAIAPALYRTLLGVREAIAAGERDYALLEARAHLGLLEAGMRPDYFSVRAAKTLEPAGSEDHDLAILAAAWLGRTRLIDNVTIRIAS